MHLLNVTKLAIFQLDTKHVNVKTSTCLKHRNERFELFNNYKTDYHNNETKLLCVNAALITETPETPKQAYRPASDNWVQISARTFE